MLFRDHAGTLTIAYSSGLSFGSRGSSYSPSSPSPYLEQSQYPDYELDALKSCAETKENLQSLIMTDSHTGVSEIGGILLGVLIVGGNPTTCGLY